MKTFNDLLLSLNACREAREWAKDKTWQEVYNTCHRGDWLLWLYAKTKDDSEESLRKLTLAKAHCANTVRHHMKDERSIKAVDVALAFGNGTATRTELNDAAADACVATYTSGGDSAAYAAYAAYAAEAAAAEAADAAAACAAAYACAYARAAAAHAHAEAAEAAKAAKAAKTKNQLETANICRTILTQSIYEKIQTY